jgi:hypothetical protein
MRTDSADPLHPGESGRGVEGNARITGTFGAAIFVLLFVEGITILRVRSLISTHAFVGMLLIPLVIVKIASTGYRIVRYYGGDTAYVAKGPPSLLLRVLGPVVVGTTVAVLATGVGALLTARRTAWLAQAHKVSFILWFGAMTVHVVGHALETPALAIADLRRTSSVPVRNAAMRIVLLVVALLAGVVLGVLSIGWSHHWQALHAR